MAAVVFAYQSLEAYANSVIPTVNCSYLLPREKSGNVERMTPQEVEKNCTTSEKLSTILPYILQVKSPKGSSCWERFVKLRRARDGVVHMKHAKMYSFGDDPDSPVYFDLLLENPLDYTRSAFDMIWYFAQTKNPQQNRPQWAMRFVHVFGQTTQLL